VTDLLPAGYFTQAPLLLLLLGPLLAPAGLAAGLLSALARPMLFTWPLPAVSASVLCSVAAASAAWLVLHLSVSTFCIAVARPFDDTPQHAN
jgi:hypothetical protein